MCVADRGNLWFEAGPGRRRQGFAVPGACLCEEGWATMAQVKLYESKKEREMVDYSADLFAILKTTERLERAYVRDAIGAKQYETACSKLLAQFRTLCTTLKGTVPDVAKFASEHPLDTCT